MPTNGGIIGKENLAGSTLTQAAKTTTFTSSGNFVADTLTTEVTYVIVAGGGGGGCNRGTGGGGAGGYRTAGSFAVSPQRSHATKPYTSMKYSKCSPRKRKNGS